MSKTMLLVVLASFSASLIGCGEGPKRNSTANQAVLKMRCQSQLAFGGNANGDKENDNLEQILVAKYANTEVPAIVTYLTKFEVSGLINVSDEQFQNIAIKADLADKFVDSTSQFVVIKNCETLTADVRGPGVEYSGMTIQSIGMQEIELSLSKDAVETTIKMKKEGRTKIIPSNDRRQKGRDMAKQKNLEAQDFANGNVILNVDIEAKSNGKTDAVSFQQLSGPMDNSHRVKLATPVMAKLTGLAADQAQVDILQSGTTVPVTAAPAEGKLTPDTAAPKNVEVSVLSLVRFQEKVLDQLPEVQPAAEASPVAPAVESGAPAPVTDGTSAAPVAAAPASPTEPSTPAVATVVK